ncbi:hypothetical protein [Egicoccus sp. AB-alg2]|uniref:hypothetical protein n=1 Tax=Egicoccus sp. AB-alg2 TaxID=3242693 RepID=UPI00359EBFD8
MGDPRQTGQRPEFGPSGYLPERASKRARKIVLRAPLGLQWVVASVLAGLVVVAAGVLFLQRSGEPPPAPWTPVGEIDELAASQPLDDLDAVLVAAGGRIRVFADAAGVAYCEPSNRLEDGARVWNLTGRGLGGAASLAEYPTIVHDGTVYVDATRTVAGPAPSSDAAEPAC